jgi:hypothetical protein
MFAAKLSASTPGRSDIQPKNHNWGNLGQRKESIIQARLAPAALHKRILPAPQKDYGRDYPSRHHNTSPAVSKNPQARM